MGGTGDGRGEGLVMGGVASLRAKKFSICL